MAKVIVVPDSHTKIEVLKEGIELATKLRADHIVLLGDYFDDWTATAEDNYAMLDFLKEALVKHKNIIPLYGNHEMSYMTGKLCSGNIVSMAEDLGKKLKDDHRFLFAVAIDGALYTHAGVTKQWLLDNAVGYNNDIRKGVSANTLEQRINGLDNFGPLCAVGEARGGLPNVAPSPLWADLKELIADDVPKLTQIVGHTPVREITMFGRCWFCDTRSNGNVNDEFLVVVNGTPEIVSYSEVMNGEG